MPIHVRRLLGPLAMALLLPAAAAAQTVTVRVVIERVRQIDDLEPGDEADFYTVTTIDGQEFETDDIANQDDVMPDWRLSADVDLPRDRVPIRIAIFESDGIFRGDDEHPDVSTGDGDRDLDLELQLFPCEVSGDATGSCGTSITSRGTDGDRAEVTFRVEVEEPPSTPGLNVTCLHSPIHPQPGEPVTISMFAVDDALGAKFVDAVEIWVDDPSAPAFSATFTNGATLNAGPFGEGTFDYGCRARDGGEAVFSGWRKVSVGDPGDYDEAIPLIFTAPRRSAIDVVFVADEDSYASAADPGFLSDVSDAIRNAYYGLPVFVSRQDAFNFWIAREVGDAVPFGSGCDHEAPDNSWADVQAILHTDSFRDCAPGGERLFSSLAGFSGILRHETGHRPFGLADEYCDGRNPPAGSSCDGGYFQASPFPNLYSTRDGVLGGLVPGCATDAPDLGRTAADCVSFQEDVEWWFDDTWFVSEPASNDLMVDNQDPQAADERRILWLLDRCDAADC